MTRGRRILRVTVSVGALIQGSAGHTLFLTDRLRKKYWIAAGGIEPGESVLEAFWRELCQGAQLTEKVIERIGVLPVF